MGRGVAPRDPGTSSAGGGPPPACRRRTSALLALWLATGCASDLVRTDDGYRHPRHHFSIGVPAGYGAPWERTEIENTWVAFRRSGSQTLSLQSSCGRPVAHPAIMARHLVIGVRERRLRQAGPVVVAGRNGWSQTFDTRADGIALRVKTVTVVIDGCTWDWSLLAVVAEFAAAERAFDAWWGTFRLDSPDDGEEDRS